MKKKNLLIASLSLMLIGCGGVSSQNTTSQSTSETPNVNEVDVYFIAGQSNAAGCSDFYRQDKTTLNLSEEYAAKAEIYKAGFENVLYFGNAYDTYEGNAYIVDELIPVKACMGVNEEYEFGAELGMAEFLNEQYKGTNKRAVIVKYAVCGSGLLTDSVAFGEWSAPSFSNNKLGNQVNLFDRMVGTRAEDYTDGIVYNALSAIANEGYTDINFKGFYWSQGEAETYGATDFYDDALSALIGDFRSAINNASESAMMEHELSIGDASELPFIISEIAPTQEGASKKADGTSSNPLINSIINQQRAVANNLFNVVTLSTEEFDIVNENAKWASSTDDGVSYCADQWHYNGDDMLVIGNTVGSMLYEGLND